MAELDLTKIIKGNDTYIINDTVARNNLANKQDTLVSGTNIKTINNESLLGSGNLNIDSLPSQSGNSGKFLTTDGTDASWTNVSASVPNQNTASGATNPLYFWEGTESQWNVGGGRITLYCWKYEDDGQYIRQYTYTRNPTTSDTIYDNPSMSIIAIIDDNNIELSDNNIYTYDAMGNQILPQTVAQAHPDWICFIEGVGIKKGDTLIASLNTVDQVYDAYSSNAQSGVAVASGIFDTLGTIETALQGV